MLHIVFTFLEKSNMMNFNYDYGYRPVLPDYVPTILNRSALRDRFTAECHLLYPSLPPFHKPHTSSEALNVSLQVESSWTSVKSFSLKFYSNNFIASDLNSVCFPYFRMPRY